MTFLEYVNICLQGINEVALTPEQLNSARGLHQFAKEAVNRAYFDIIGESKWPWMQDNDVLNTSLGALELSGERSLEITSQWTPIPLDNAYTDVLDWSSIYFRDNENNRFELRELTWEEYEDYLDYIETLDTTEPRLIVKSADGRSIGLFPLPDITTPGRLYYRIWSRPSRYTLATDIVNLPDQDYNVLVDGALTYLSTFRSDNDAASISYNRYKEGIKRMKRKYGNQGNKLRVI